MTVRLRSDRHPSFGPGFALLDFGRPINAARLEISVLNTITGLYLGPSAPGHPNWVKLRANFFPAVRAGGENSSICRVGPEVTTYIHEGTYVEIASADDSVRAELSWEGVLLRVNPAGTEKWTSRPEAFELSPNWVGVTKASGRSQLDPTPEELEAEASRRTQEAEEQRRKQQEAAAAMQAKREADEQERRRAEQATAAQRASEEQAKLAAAKAQDELEAQLRASTVAHAKREADEQERRRTVTQVGLTESASASTTTNVRNSTEEDRIPSEGFFASNKVRIFALAFSIVVLLAIAVTFKSPLELWYAYRSFPDFEETGSLAQITFKGPAGGPFSPPMMEWTIFNPGSASRNIFITADAQWIKLNENSLSLKAGERKAIQIRLNPSARLMSPGHYNGGVNIDEWGTDLRRGYLVVLEISGSEPLR